ncbi:BlaI/MecI/CopY family transcriptional regulator [Anaerostipes sp.]|uniref:BlaI/MecI/CopY family transcriptional regulator n=1 Tax=Anaerostipes sp. TaxID=1872530 RepID=UPI0025BF9279|nr:BlaI/MecI/CopY family transcriptional regulator [Anaerostipes sp.]MBS7007459.1 BlaI/MecI/CopY family transcriptional regulator [Anaerostipes sp.]
MEERKLTYAEEVVMRCVWNYGEDEIPFLTLIEELRENYNKDYKRTTVRTFLFDLEEKGYVKVERRGKFSYVIPLVQKEDYRKAQAEAMLDIWFDGSAGSLISALSESLSEEEAKRLNQLLDELDVQ